MAPVSIILEEGLEDATGLPFEDLQLQGTWE